jgi:hypothetical protein
MFGRLPFCEAADREPHQQAVHGGDRWEIVDPGPGLRS